MSGKKIIADFFLKEENPYSKKRAVKVIHIVIAFGLIAIIVLIIGSFLDSRAEKQALTKSANQASNDDANQAKAQAAAGAAGAVKDDKSFLGIHIGGSGSQVSGSRQYSASQIIKRGDTSGDSLPSGTQIHVRLAGRAESADSETPITAMVTEPAMSPVGSELIPAQSKLIGQARLDVARERLQVQFQTVVFPDGEQFSLSALAQMPDGTSGLVGKFSSGAIGRTLSQFAGNFIGGVAEGLEDRTTGGGIGIPFEPGSVKNGLLNGAAQSSLGYAKSNTDKSGQSQASISVDSGLDFLAYISQGFHQ